MRARVQVAAALALLAVAAPARAIDDVETPRVLGMGGAARGAAVGALGPLFNPAGMILRKQYSIEAFYAFRVQDLGHTLHASIVDSVTSRVAAGLYYSYLNSTPKFTYLDAIQGKREGHESGLALAIALGERFGFGLTSKYLSAATEVEVSNPEALSNPKAPSAVKVKLDSTVDPAPAKGFTLDAGIILRLGDAFNIGVTGHNLIPTNSIEAPIAMGIGLSYLLGTQLLLAGDVKIDFNKYKLRDVSKPEGPMVSNRITARVAIGLEWLIKGLVALRGGFVYDGGLPSEAITFGLGYVGKQFGVDLGYKQRVGGGLESQLGLGLRIFLE